MSFEQYSPLDTTIPFYSNHETIPYINSVDDETLVRISFLDKFKSIARRVKITNTTKRTAFIYLNGDLANPIQLGNSLGPTSISTSFNQWIRSIRIIIIAESGSGDPSGIELDYDLVHTRYLPNRERAT